MTLDYFPEDVKPHLIPEAKGELYYKCLGCSAEYSIEKLLYVCPECNQVLLIHDRNIKDLQKIPGPVWQKIFDFRKMLKIPALKGIYRYHEFMGPAFLWNPSFTSVKAIHPLLNPMKHLKKW